MTDGCEANPTVLIVRDNKITPPPHVFSPLARFIYVPLTVLAWCNNFSLFLRSASSNLSQVSIHSHRLLHFLLRPGLLERTFLPAFNATVIPNTGVSQTKDAAQKQEVLSQHTWHRLPVQRNRITWQCHYGLCLWTYGKVDMIYQF